MLSSIAAATTAVAVIFTLIDFAVISFVVAMVWLTLKERKAKAAEVQVVEVPEAPVVKEEPKEEKANGNTYVYIQVNNNEAKTETPVVKEVAAVEAPAEKPKAEFSEVVVSSTPRLTFEEAYAALSKAQRSFFDGLLEYANSKPNTKETRARTFISVKVGYSLILKLTIKREMTVASFALENDKLKSYRKEVNKTKGTKINVRAVDVPIYDVNDYEVARGLIDVSCEQIVEDREQTEEERAERRRQARQAKKAKESKK